MLHYWAVLGCLVGDPDFHKKTYAVLRKRERALREHLTDGKFILSRLEVSELLELLTRGVNGTLALLTDEYQAAAEELDFRNPDFPESANFYAAMGLACIDGEFRGRLAVASGDIDLLERVLADGDPLPEPASQEKGPKLPMKSAEYRMIAALFKKHKTTMFMDDFQKAAWWHQEKIFGACPQGFFLKDVLYAAPTYSESAQLARTNGRVGEFVEAKKADLSNWL